MVMGGWGIMMSCRKLEGGGWERGVGEVRWREIGGEVGRDTASSGKQAEWKRPEVIISDVAGGAQSVARVRRGGGVCIVYLHLYLHPCWRRKWTVVFCNCKT